MVNPTVLARKFALADGSTVPAALGGNFVYTDTLPENFEPSIGHLALVLTVSEGGETHAETGIQQVLMMLKVWGPKNKFNEVSQAYIACAAWFNQDGYILDDGQIQASREIIPVQTLVDPDDQDAVAFGTFDMTLQDND